MKKITALIIVIIYILSILTGLGYLTWILNNSDNSFIQTQILPLNCMLTAGFGGCLYCMRAIYLSSSVRKQWDNSWLTWYLLRPVASLICGGVSFIFLKAGLLVLEAKKDADSTNLGFFALALIAGLNVDRFISKIEDLAKATWGIEKSRASGGNSEAPGHDGAGQEEGHR